VSALNGRERPPHETEIIDHDTRARERLMLGLRLDEPLRLEEVRGALDGDAAERLVAGGLVEVSAGERGSTVTLTRRGRFLGGGVTAELMELASA
jgi:coproporphyrinogen III oxidase-like Fe-S oxidoreductase